MADPKANAAVGRQSTSNSDFAKNKREKNLLAPVTMIIGLLDVLIVVSEYKWKE